ncbi:MAG: succinate dehydrogenase (quinone) flavoprotein subunit, partial [Ignavibacteriaceae bacterium]|nr:succinate dehydrogenase (quinone) flavoprotein subunit [Ignavibacteriaceae bacterium]
RGETGQQLLLGAYSAMMRQVGLGNVEIFPRSDVQDIVVIDGRARGIVLRDMVSGKIESYIADAVILATGGYGNVFYLSTNAKGCNATAIWRAHKKGALFANPCFTQIHPTCIPVSGSYQSKLTLMSESLRNDGRIWVPKDPKDKRAPNEIPESERDYFLERKYPSFGNLVPRDVASRNAKEMIDDGKGVGLTGKAVYLDFAEAIQRLGKDTITEKYGNLFEMYEQITNEDPYEVPMRIYPASHYTMGGLWVDYNLMTSIPGLFALGECNFSDHGANRLGASALMQGLADGYFIISYSISDYLAQLKKDKLTTDAPEFKQSKKEVAGKINRLLNINGSKTVDELHRELGIVMWDYVGMSRNAEGLTKAKKMIKEIREDFWKNVKIIGTNEEINQSLEKAARVADFLELGELIAEDALQRKESCGGHFREESQTEENEAKRDDDNFSHVAAWEYAGPDKPEILNKEQLEFEFVKPSQRSYK